MECRVCYRYHFDELISMDDVEDALTLAVIATEALHGESRLRLDARYLRDQDSRALVLDATSEIGRHFNQIVCGFVRRDLGDDAFTVERMLRPREPASAVS